MDITKYFIVELDAFDGQYGSITPNLTPSFFCVGVMTDGVIKLVDWGYPSEDDLVQAWPELASDYGYLSEDSVPLKGRGD